MEKAQDSQPPSMAPTVPSPGKNNNNVPGVPESPSASIFDGLDQTEIERLGRVRPECFKTRWSEVAFVSSICMAQILVVRTQRNCFPRSWASANASVPGVLCFWIQCDGTDCCRCSWYSSSISNMAGISIFTRYILLLAANGQTV